MLRVPGQMNFSYAVRRIGCLAVISLLGAGLALAPAALADGPISSGSNPQSVRDGCQRDPAALISQQTPEWTYVNNTPSDQPSPSPQWVSGVVNAQNPAFQAMHTSGADFAFGHNSLDMNLNILVDPQYQSLLAGSPNDPNLGGAPSGNYPGNGEETGRLHTENEDLTVPHYVWPEPGDRVTERGNWVWDCGHWGTPTNVFSPDYDLPHVGQPCPLPGPTPDPNQCAITGERTEFHPFRALFTDRQQSPNSPYGEKEGDVYVSTDATKAGITEDCAHKFPPPTQSQAYPPAFKACVETAPNWQDVTGDYSFLLQAPPKPSPDAQLTFRAVDQGSINAPAPTLTAEGDAVRITFHLDSPAPDVTGQFQRVREAYRVFVGWAELPSSAVPTHLRVTFDSLDIHRAMDPGCSRQQPVPGCQNQSTRQNQGTTAPGDWNLYWDVNGNWGTWPSVPPGQPPTEFLPNDGTTYDRTQNPSSVPAPVDLYVPPGRGWRLYVHGRECDINDVDPAHPLDDCPTNTEIADDNDVPGLFVDTYSSANASLGSHSSDGAVARDDPTSTCPNSNPNGCYTINYTVSKVLPDLSISKTDSPDPVDVGENLNYTVTVTNNTSGTAAGGVSLTDNLPSGVTFESATPSQGSCAQASGTVTCDLGSLRGAETSGNAATIKITVAPNSAGTITNSASVSTSGGDADSSNNSATESTTVAPYPSPVGASPARVSLVPSFRPCEVPSADSRHGAPLAFLSCSTPHRTSALVTLGPKALGFARFVVCASGSTSGFCNPSTAMLPKPDVRLTASVRDVKCVPVLPGGQSECSAGGADYDPNGAPGPYSDGGDGASTPAQPPCFPSATSSSDCLAGADLTQTAEIPGASVGAQGTSFEGRGVRVTDSDNGPSSNDPATMVDIGFPVPIDCIPTNDLTVGSTCGANTSANALVPGVVQNGKRAVWQLGEVELKETGPDGVRGNADDQVLAVQGVYLP